MHRLQCSILLRVERPLLILYQCPNIERNSNGKIHVITVVRDDSQSEGYFMDLMGLLTEQFDFLENIFQCNMMDARRLQLRYP